MGEAVEKRASEARASEASTFAELSALPTKPNHRVRRRTPTSTLAMDFKTSGVPGTPDVCDTVDGRGLAEADEV